MAFVLSDCLGGLPVTWQRQGFVGPKSAESLQLRAGPHGPGVSTELKSTSLSPRGSAGQSPLLRLVLGLSPL